MTNETTMPPRVTFVVTNFNYGRFLAQAIDSLLSQTFEALELIVIDDASTDDSAALLARYAEHPRVRVIHHATNQGHIAAYNEGLALARGEFVGVVAADDFCVRPDAVAAQVAMLDAHPAAGFVYGACQFADEQGKPVWVKRPAAADYVREGRVEFAQLAFNCDIPHSGTLVRKSCHNVVGYYDPRLPHAGDWDMWLRLAARWPVAYIAEPLFAYRIHRTNMHHARISPGQAKREHVLTIQKAFAALPAEAPAQLHALQPAALRKAWLRATAIECSSGRRRRAWTGLLDAARRSPRLVVSGVFLESLAKVLLLSVFGHAGYTWLAMRRRAA